MTKKLLIAGGVFNVIFTLFHCFLGWKIREMTNIPPAQLAIMQELNFGSLLMIAFAAYASLFCTNDLLTTKLGKAALVFITLFYAARALAEIVISPGFSIVIFGICLLVALIYLLIILRTRAREL